jgi:hypothetical protein
MMSKRSEERRGGHPKLIATPRIGRQFLYINSRNSRTASTGGYCRRFESEQEGEKGRKENPRALFRRIARTNLASVRLVN